MEILRKRLALKTNYEFYLHHLGIINVLLPSEKIDGREMEILAAFMSHNGDEAEEDRFNRTIRKKVKDRLELSSGSLSNHLRSLIKKGFLDKNETTGKITIKSFLYPKDNKIQGYEIVLGNVIKQ